MHARTLLVLGPLALLVPYAGGCGDDDPKPPTTESDELADVVYQGEATDEALEDMLTLPVQAGGKRATFTSPASGASISAPPTFSWTFDAPALDAGALGAVTPLMPASGLRLSPGLAAGAAPRSVPRSPTGWLASARLLFGERSAFAHGTPLNGTGYFLVLSTDTNDKVLRVFTTDTSYTPDAGAWEAVKKAGGAVHAVVTTGLFDNNKVISGGGPFEGDPLTFNVTP
jgi:hypothetical protein